MVLGFETFCAPLLRNLLSAEPVGSPRPEQYHSDRKQREYRSCSHHRVVVCPAFNQHLEYLRTGAFARTHLRAAFTDKLNFVGAVELPALARIADSPA